MNIDRVPNNMNPDKTSSKSQTALGKDSPSGLLTEKKESKNALLALLVT